MTGGQSVEDDKRDWIPYQVRDDKGCVIPVKTGIQTGLDPQSEALRFRLRMTGGQSVEDDEGCVIPAKAGIQAGLDPQSEALRFRLRMTRGVSFPHPFRHSRESGNPVIIDPRSGRG